MYSTDSKFLIYGQFRYPNGFTKDDCLCYLELTAEDAVTKCRKNHQYFHIDHVELDDTFEESLCPPRVQSIQ